MPTVNSLEFTDWLSMECLRLLKNKRFILKGFNTDYASDFQKEFAVGETVRVPYPWRPIGGDGMAFDPEPIDRRHFTVTVDQTPHVHFEVGSVEEALKFTRGKEKISNEILKPAMDRVAQNWEIKGAQWAAINIPNYTGVLGTDPTTLGFAGTARARLIQMAGWTGTKRTAAISPSVMQSIVNAASVTTPVYNPRDLISKAFVEGYLGENGGWEFAESMSLMQITAGERAGAITISSTATSGATSLVLACTSGDTFYAGEKFSVVGRYAVNPGSLQRANTVNFQCSIAGIAGQVYTATAATITIPITDAIEGPGSGYQNITVMPTAGDSVTFWEGTSAGGDGLSGTLSVLFNRDACAFVPVRLKNPKGSSVELASQATDPETGLSVSIVHAFDPVSRQWVYRFDTLGGFGNFYVRNCGVVLAGV
jgi:hypothetical protein